MKEIINKYLKKARNNGKVIENYVFMTSLQVFNALFYLILYPYLIRVLGVYEYGVFAYATSIGTAFVFLVNFGFDLPATKFIVENLHSKKDITKLVSKIFSAKFYLFLFSLIIFFIIVFFSKTIENRFLVFFLCFLNIISYVIIPQWYFQATQKMKVLTYIQLFAKIVALPFIFIFVKTKSDLLPYCFIVTLSGILSGLIVLLFLRIKENVTIRFYPVDSLIDWFVISLPFFYSSLAGSIKEYSIPLLIGNFFGMREVAIFDLANKLIVVPRMLFMNINAAIYPKVLEKFNFKIVNKIIKWEVVLSLFVFLFFLIFGKLIIEIVAGVNLLESYVLVVLLSFTILPWLVVGAYIHFVFIPHNVYHYITKNQIVALVSFSFFLLPLFLVKNILVFGVAIAVSGLSEILFCLYIVHKKKYLKPIIVD